MTWEGGEERRVRSVVAEGCGDGQREKSLVVKEEEKDESDWSEQRDRCMMPAGSRVPPVSHPKQFSHSPTLFIMELIYSHLST